MGKTYRLKKIDKIDPVFIEDFMRELRQDDRRELLAFAGNVQKEIEDSIRFSSECWAALTENNEPIVLFGKTILPERDGALIWCLGTDRLEEYWLPFLRQSRIILEHWVKEHGFLYNSLAEFNTAHMRWLAWLGARFGETINVNGENFVRFVIEGDV